MSGKIPVRIVTDGDGTLGRVGVDFGPRHNFEVVTASDQRSGGHLAMSQSVATALGISVSSTTYPLDGLTAPVAAWSVSGRLISTFSGAPIRLRRSTGGEQDIAQDGNGDVDTASAATFVGANNGFVVTAYDQIGSNNATTATAGNQPTFISAGSQITCGGKPAVKPQTSGAGLATIAAPWQAGDGDFTYILVAIAPTDNGTRDFFRNSVNGNENYAIHSSGRWFVVAAETNVTGAIPINTNIAGTSPRIYAVRRTGSSVELFRNNEAVMFTGTGGTALSAATYTLFCGPTDRTYTDIIFWRSALSNADLSAVRSRLVTRYGAAYP